MSVNALYTTTARATGGRDGVSKTLDGSFEVKLSTPKELGGAGGEGNNPEQLFAAGYAACFLGAMKLVASQNSALKLSKDANVTATVGIGPRSEGGFGLTISLDIDLIDMDKKLAQNLIDDSHQVCPYSNATRNNIDVKLTLV